MKKNTYKTRHTHVKNLKRQLTTKDFLWRLELHVGNWNEWLLVVELLLKGQKRKMKWIYTAPLL